MDTSKIKDCIKELGYRPDFCICKNCRKSLRDLEKNIANNPTPIPLGIKEESLNKQTNLLFVCFVENNHE